MRLFLRLLLFVALYVGVNLMTALVLNANLWAGVYPPEADSIGIAQMYNLLTSLLSLLMLLPLLLLSSLRSSFRRAATSPAWRRTLGILLAGLYAWNLLLQVNWAIYWLEPDHSLIGISIGLVPVALLWLAIVDFRRFRALARLETSSGPGA